MSPTRWELQIIFAAALLQRPSTYEQAGRSGMSLGQYLKQESKQLVDEWFDEENKK